MQEGSTQEKREGRDPFDMCKRDNGKTIQPEQRCSSGKEENEVRWVEQRHVVVPKVGKRRFDSTPLVIGSWGGLLNRSTAW